MKLLVILSAAAMACVACREAARDSRFTTADGVEECLRAKGFAVSDASIAVDAEVTPGLSAIRGTGGRRQGVAIQVRANDEEASRVERKPRPIAGGIGAPRSQKWASHNGPIVYWAVTATSASTRAAVISCAEAVLSD
jgi:hypothetical protein